MIKDEGKFYTVMRVHTRTRRALAGVHFRYGKRLMEKKDPVLGDYLVREKKRVEGILEKSSGGRAQTGGGNPGPGER